MDAAAAEPGIILKGGTVIDPAQGIHGQLDVLMRAGMIEQTGADLSVDAGTECIDVRGKVLTPGLVDLHTHVAEALMPLGLDPDEAGVRSGVTTVCDAGSVGYANYDAFVRLVIAPAHTEVFSFLHLCPFGQAISPEVGWEGLDRNRILDLASRERERIVGIKIRANSPRVVEPEMHLLKTAKSIASELGLPLMVHIGMNSEDEVDPDVLSEFNRGMLSTLNQGDILTHAYTQRPGAVLDEKGNVPEELRAAIDRGLLIDAAPAKSHMSFETTRRAMDEGVIPTTLSTDITNTNYRGPAMFSLPVVMSKFLALGMSLDDIVDKTTRAPAGVIGKQDRLGSLEVGRSADISVFEILEGDFTFLDGIAGNTLLGHKLLEPRLCFKKGERFEASSRFRDHDPDVPVTLTPGA